MNLHRLAAAWLLAIALFFVASIVLGAQGLAPASTSTSTQMGAQAVAVCGTAVLMLAQLVKWILQPPDRAGAGIVVILAAGAVMFWAWSKGVDARADGWDLFVSWLVVSTSAAGVFGLSRTTTGAITDFKERRAEEK